MGSSSLISATSPAVFHSGFSPPGYADCDSNSLDWQTGFRRFRASVLLHAQLGRVHSYGLRLAEQEEDMRARPEEVMGCAFPCSGHDYGTTTNSFASGLSGNDWRSSLYVPPLQILCYNPASEETTLANLSGIVKQLSKERDRLHQQLSGLNAALEAFAGVYRGNNGIKPGRTVSAKGRASIAAAQRARWAKVRGQMSESRSDSKPKRTMSASARRKMAVAQRARWAKVKRGTRKRPNVDYSFSEQQLTTSRTLPSLPSGWGCWGQHLAKRELHPAPPKTGLKSAPANVPEIQGSQDRGVQGDRSLAPWRAV